MRTTGQRIFIKLLAYESASHWDCRAWSFVKIVSLPGINNLKKNVGGLKMRIMLVLGPKL